MNAKGLFPLSFSITLPGILYLLSVILLSYAVLHTSNNLLYMVLASLISAFVVSSIVSRNSLKQSSLSIRIPENVFEGETVPVRISVVNTHRLIPSFSVRIESIREKTDSSAFDFFRRLLINKKTNPGIPDAGMPEEFHLSAYFPVLRPGETHSQPAVQSFPHRGLFRMNNIRLSTRFPFGLFRHIENIGITGEVLVYPAIRDLSTFFHRIPFPSGFPEGAQKGEGEDLFSIRPYGEGESARIIDWKATAKTGEPMGREFAGEEQCRCCLVLDTETCERSTGGFWKEFETAVSFSASIAAALIKNGAGMELLTPVAHLPYSGGRNHLSGILRFLATVEYTCAAPETHASFLSRSGLNPILDRISSEKAFTIILTSRNREAFPEAILKRARFIHFGEL